MSKKHLERHAWSLEQCEKMVQEVLEGERELTEKPETRPRLRRMLGLPEAQMNQRSEPSESDSPSHVAKVSRVGRRNPVRDKVGQ